jgi:bifunctional DNase/RNase
METSRSELSEAEIVGFGNTSPPIILLRCGEDFLPMVIRVLEAKAISDGLNGHTEGRPMTHDLICNILAGVDCELKSVTIYKLERDTFYAHLNIEQKNGDGDAVDVLRIDARPSDSMAIAVRKKVPILVADSVIEEVGRTAEEVGFGSGDEDDE